MHPMDHLLGVEDWRVTGPGPGGRVLAKIPAPTSATAAIAQIPAASVETAVTAELSSGPLSIPASESNLQRAKNLGRPTVGESSAPRVITIPAPKPLPRPIKNAPIISHAPEVVNGMTAQPMVSPVRQETATTRRPLRSMIDPAG